MSRLLDHVRRIRRIGKARRAAGSLAWARLLEQHGVDVRTVNCEPRETGLFFPALGMVVPGPGESVLLRGFHRAARLHAQGVQFDGFRTAVHATFDSVTVRVSTTEELQILEEILLAGAYHFVLQGPLLIVDVGMNTGYTALYFAANHPDSVVCGYELLAPTFRQAQENIALNPELGARIRPFNVGISDSDRTVDIEYVERWRGSVGIYGLPAGLDPAGESRMEPCEVRDAASALADLYNEYGGRRVVLKLDCEGSEYRILGRLAESGLLARADLLMIECHRRAEEHDPAALRGLLSTHGFGCVHLHPDATDISMLYAMRVPSTGCLGLAADRDAATR